MRHERIHAIHQRLAPGGHDISHAERVAWAGQQGERVPVADLLHPAPPLLAFPPQKYKPFNQVWIGLPGLILEVVESGITVRIFRSYSDLGLSHYTDYECKTKDFKGSKDLAERMAKAANVVSAMNVKIPKTATTQRTSFIAISGKASALRENQGQGIILLNEADFFSSSYQDTLAHEESHGIFEYHSIKEGKPKERKPDPLALEVARIYSELSDTTPVPIPKRLFDAKKPPATTGGGETQPAGLIMVMDVLWSGSGGHPWQGVDEFFASAYAGYQRNPSLLKASVNFYAKLDKKIAPLAKQLFSLLDTVGDPKAEAKIKKPADTKAAEQVLGAVKENLDVSEVLQMEGRLDWILDPTLMPSPDKIPCKTSTQPAKSSVDKEIEDLLER